MPGSLSGTTRRSLAVLAGLIVVLAVALVPTGAAQAYGDGTCHSGDFCVWKDINEGGSFSDLNPTVSDYDGLQYTNGCCLNDTVSSSKNRSASKYVRLWQHRNNGGLYLTHLPDGQYSGSLAFAYVSLGYMNDIASSNEERTTP